MPTTRNKNERTIEEHQMKKSDYVRIVLAVVVWASGMHTIDAAIVTFDNKAAVLDATGATSATGVLPNWEM